ncbi:MAG: 2-C-methyl-D-erythritol 2,4-cyclodiphosphate synthase [Burkholderiales bacterium]|nr:2-C-methyl-D-erythritol 2,4-cyclodiphosphate synthase [Burkholderiales bacterium]
MNISNDNEECNNQFTPAFRIGQGFDLHRLVAGRKLILGGVEIPHNLGLLGHSDADVLVHALIDALIGAVALGDIGKFFPDNDAQYKDISSRLLLIKTWNKIKSSTNYIINNIDATIIIQTPKLRNYIDIMRANIADDLKIQLNQINIKAKTSEGIGIVGRNEAVIAEVVVLLVNQEIAEVQRKN